ncbi:MAG: hypothetical protein WA294_17010 [Acidobacteriaceae bacterium]
MPGQVQAPTAPGKLVSWKTIAQYFDCDERTARRWERERGLPVHRVPGGKRSAVFAYPVELDRWLQEEGEPLPTAPARPAGRVEEPGRGSRTQDKRRILTAMAATAVVIAGTALSIGLQGHGRPAGIAIAGAQAPQPAPRHNPLPGAEELYLRGRYFWSLRTADSLAKAIDAYTQAVVRDPSYAEAYAGLAESYDILPQFARADPGEAFSRAMNAANKAIELNVNLASAHRAKAFALFFWDWDIAGSDAEFRRALALDPNSAETHHWYASTLLNRLEGAECLRQIEEAQRLNPGSAAIATDAALFGATFGDDLEGSVVKLREMEDTQPALRTPADFLGGIAFAQGDYPAYLAQLRRIASVTNDPDDIATAAGAARGWQRGGRNGMLQELVRARSKAFESGNDTGFTLGQMYLLLGQPQQALPYFRAALNQRVIVLITMDQCDWAKGLAADPGYAQLFSEIRGRLHGGGPAHPAVVPTALQLPQ